MNSITSFLRKVILKKLEKQKQHYEQRAYNNLSKLYSIIRPGDVVLVEGRSDMSRLIKLFSNSHWSHAAMYIGKALINVDHKEGDSYLKKYGEDANHMLVEAFTGKGVIATPLKKYKDYNIRLCRPYGIFESDLHHVIEQVTDSLGMRHYTQIIPKDFDLSPNFEVIKYNIKGTILFDYKSLWIERL